MPRRTAARRRADRAGAVDAARQARGGAEDQAAARAIAHDAPSRHFLADIIAVVPDRARPADHGHVPAVAAGDRAGARCVDGPGATDHFELPDRLRRRPVILAALVLYGVATIVCAVAQSIEILIAVRFVQALGGAGCIVLARAAVRDLYSGVRAGRELSLMGSITAFAPIVAPAIGGVLQTAFGWRASFVLLVAFALAAGSAAALLLPETLRQRASGPFSLASMGGLYRSVLVHRGFLANLGILVASFVGLFAWIAGAPFVMQDLYGLTPVV